MIIADAINGVSTEYWADAVTPTRIKIASTAWRTSMGEFYDLVEILSLYRSCSDPFGDLPLEK